ncbi:MAG TPA: PPC domain-containing DNA-binding protein [Patescibacteria group bacterium]|nr:PPC domain-containing DNA-binding protein [Patescibacteria group bacterium]
MEMKRFGSKIVIRCDKQEEIVEVLKQVCRENNIKLASLTGIGAVGEAVIGLFDPRTKEYHSMKLEKDMEIVGLVGNVSRMNGEVYLHAHITLTDRDYNAFGGHLTAAWVSCTAEIIMDVIEGELERGFDNEIGLNLLRF